MSLADGVKCPVCKRLETVTSCKRVYAPVGPRFETLYICRCGCEWVDPPRVTPVVTFIPNATQPTFVAELPKPRDATCVKCGTGNPSVKFEDGMLRFKPPERFPFSPPPDPYRIHDERLRFTCCACSHTWTRPTLDAKPDPSPGDDPLQATVTLGVLNKMLADHERKLCEQIEDRMRRGAWGNQR